MGMRKLLECGIKKYGSAGALQRELVKQGVSITSEAIRKGIEDNRGDKTRQVYSALNRLLHAGNWTKTGKLIDED